ncbi:MAG: helix-turn-helix transcriptional regulator [Promethearchaeota archaeon]
MDKKRAIWFFFIAFLFFTPNSPLKANNSIPKKPEIQTTLKQTDIKFTSASLNFSIYPQGKYSCRFSLSIVGDEEYSHGSLCGMFKLKGKNISNWNIHLFTSSTNLFSSINTNFSVFSNFSVCNFIISQGLLPGEMYELMGYFQGIYDLNNSDIITYHLGIDWGSLIPVQRTFVSFDNRDYTLVLPIEPTPHDVENPRTYITELNWLHGYARNFTLNLNLLQKDSPNIYLIVDNDFWNASIGQTITITLENTAHFPINGWIIRPNWITSNVTKFTILANQKLVISLKISSKANLGMNGTIEIVTEEFLDEIVIPVYVLYEKTSNSSQNDLYLLLAFFSLSFIVGTIGLAFYQRNNISQIIQRLKKQETASNRATDLNSPLNPDNSLISSEETLIEEEISWNLIQSRWQIKLPEDEFKVLEILFNKGSANQQSLADEIEVSKMKMSRIITRLETKGLLSRERLGMSNIIKLNKERL